VVLQESGEHVLITAGEVHLQRCLRDLRESYAKIEINASQPIVPFRETIVAPLEPIDNDSAGRVQVNTSGKRFSMRLRAVSLPEEVTSLLEKHVDIIRTMSQTRCVNSLETTAIEDEVNEKLILQLQSKISKLYDELDQAFQKSDWKDNAVDKILSFGPRRCGPNVLINYSPIALPNPWKRNVPETIVERSTLDCLSSVINGFQLATLAGPLCEEPLFGVAFILEDLSIMLNHPSIPLSNGDDNNDGSNLQQQYGSLTGQIMSVVKDGCRRAFMNQPQRLMAAMYTCSIQVSGEVVGK
jgi:ribosome assembly protein 1